MDDADERPDGTWEADMEWLRHEYAADLIKEAELRGEPVDADAAVEEFASHLRFLLREAGADA
jgi:hypothetical protein